jgi:hypothetical protein
MLAQGLGRTLTAPLKEVMMVILSVILGPLAVLFIYAVVSDLRRRRRRGAVRGHDINSAVRTTRADAETRASGAPGVGV